MIEKKGFYSDKRAGENTRIIDRSFITQHLTISFVKVTRVATIKWVELLSKLEQALNSVDEKKVKTQSNIQFTDSMNAHNILMQNWCTCSCFQFQKLKNKYQSCPRGSFII